METILNFLLDNMNLIFTAIVALFGGVVVGVKWLAEPRTQKAVKTLMKGAEDGELSVDEMVQVLKDYFGKDKEFKQMAKHKVSKLKKK